MLSGKASAVLQLIQFNEQRHTAGHSQRKDPLKLKSGEEPKKLFGLLTDLVNVGIPL